MSDLEVPINFSDESTFRDNELRGMWLDQYRAKKRILQSRSD